MKFATHQVLFGNDKWLKKNIENTYDHFDKIYIAYSESSWNYKERQTIKLDIDYLRSYDKIKIIDGVWDKEEDQRNACLNEAKKDGMDFLAIIDTDEFYFYDDLEKMKKYVFDNQKYSLYRNAWYNFWKDDFITIKEDGNKIAGYPDTFINLNHNIKFTDKRTTTRDNIGIISDVICYHMSYVLSDEELKIKLETWGHTNDFDTKKWYEEVWIRWNENMIHLHPIQPKEWYKAIKFEEKMPEVLDARG